MIYGFRKGIIHSVVTLLALIIGIMTAVHLSEQAAVYVDKWFNISSKYLPLISFIAVFIAIYFIFRLIEEALEGFFKLIKMNILNKLTGAIVWGLIWTLFYSTILFYLNNMGAFKEQIKSDSVVYESVEPLAPKTISTIGQIIPPVKNIFNNMEGWFREQDNANKDGHPAEK